MALKRSMSWHEQNSQLQLRSKFNKSLFEKFLLDSTPRAAFSTTPELSDLYVEDFRLEASLNVETVHQNPKNMLCDG